MKRLLSGKAAPANTAALHLAASGPSESAAQGEAAADQLPAASAGRSFGISVFPHPGKGAEWRPGAQNSKKLLSGKRIQCSLGRTAASACAAGGKPQLRRWDEMSHRLREAGKALGRFS